MDTIWPTVQMVLLWNDHILSFQGIKTSHSIRYILRISNCDLLDYVIRYVSYFHFTLAFICTFYIFGKLSKIGSIRLYQLLFFWWSIFTFKLKLNAILSIDQSNEGWNAIDKMNSSSCRAWKWLSMWSKLKKNNYWMQIPHVKNV